jgi:hypothetical protein
MTKYFQIPYNSLLFIIRSFDAVESDLLTSLNPLRIIILYKEEEAYREGPQTSTDIQVTFHRFGRNSTKVNKMSFIF